jgi:hypothetical protein
MPGRAAISESEGLRPPIGVPLFSGLERNDADYRILDTRIGRTRADLKSLFELIEVSYAARPPENNVGRPLRLSRVIST